VGAPRFMIDIQLTSDDLEFCKKHADLMCKGFFTYSFKNDQVQSNDVYLIGKIGELACKKFLEGLDKVKILHEPFRDSYAKYNKNDDFIIEKDGVKTQIEVRTKQRSVAPKGNYECCTDCIKPDMLYLFVSYNKTNNIATLLGTADWEVFSTSAWETKKGSENNNFVHKVTEFNVFIKDLDLIERFSKVV